MCFVYVLIAFLTTWIQAPASANANSSGLAHLPWYIGASDTSGLHDDSKC